MADKILLSKSKNQNFTSVPLFLGMVISSKDGYGLEKLVSDVEVDLIKKAENLGATHVLGVDYKFIVLTRSTSSAQYAVIMSGDAYRLAVNSEDTH